MTIDESEPSTAGLSIFYDRFIKQGSYGQVFVAEYKGENAVAKVFWQCQNRTQC